jgi:50S ribosomal protein L16 3-hydroxylase
MPGFQAALDADDLAELSCEDDADARLVVHRENEDPAWTVEHGPFDPETFDTLPDRGWTLLVQAVDAWLPDVAALRSAFDFLPRWRLDDIMISHAVEQGGVGPHIDQYDVFLLQASGRRQWRYGNRSNESHAYRADLDLRILERFEPTNEAVLEPGDLLYLPPGVAHDGLALDNDCLTYSIGFRAPSVTDLASRFADVVAQRADDRGDIVPRYSDAGRSRPADPTLIDRTAIADMATLLKAAIADDGIVARTVGESMTEPRLPPDPMDRPAEPAEVMARIVSGDRLDRALGSRWAHIGLGTDALLCVDGECRQTESDLAALLCADLPIDEDRLTRWRDDAGLWSLLAEFLSHGSLVWHDADPDR